MTEKPLSGRIALVTGASRGIGYESALALAQAGAHVVAVARTQGGLEELDDAIFKATGEHVTLVPLDLAEGDGLDQLGGVIHQRFGRLDILLHAGAMLGGLTPVSHMDVKQWDRVVAVDYSATFRLIRSFEPLLRAAPTGRAIFLTSGVASRPRAFWGPYAAAKAGMEALVRCWADEVENSQIRAVIVDPGRMRTNIINSLWVSYASNNIRREHIRITRSDGVKVRVVYEVRKPWVGNLDIVGKFEKSTTLH